MIKDFLKTTQPIFYQTLYNAFSSGKIPHAFLLCAKKGIDTHETAMFIAKCLICQEDVLCCEVCNDCLRLDQNNYVDLKRFDGKDESIKKKHIESIQEEFTKSSYEGGAKIYILENIDNATPEAMNSLLKMLEEPTAGIYAVLTCENENKVLPTIQSRTLVVHFRAVSPSALANHLIEQGMKKEDALILANIYDSEAKIKEAEATELYMQLKVEALNFVEDYYLKKENLLINCQTHIFKEHHEKNEIQFFLDILLVLFKDVLYTSYNLDIAFCDHLDFIHRFNVQKEEIITILEKIIEVKEAIKSNANLMLLLDRFVYEL